MMFTEENGGLAGGVKAPAIINFSLFWRPVQDAKAIVVADGILWFGEGRELVKSVCKGQMRFQILIRVLFRFVAMSVLSTEKGIATDGKDVGKFQAAADIVVDG